MGNFGGRLFAGRLFAGQLFGRRTTGQVQGPTDTDHYRRIARHAMSLRVVGDANPVMIAIGRRRR